MNRKQYPFTLIMTLILSLMAIYVFAEVGEQAYVAGDNCELYDEPSAGANVLAWPGFGLQVEILERNAGENQTFCKVRYRVPPLYEEMVGYIDQTLLTEEIPESPSKEKEQTINVGEYVSSENCKACHEKQYRTWSKNWMSRFVRQRRDVKRLPVSWFGCPSEVKKMRDNILLVVGGRRKVALVAEHWNVLPYQYNRRNQRWERRKDWEFGFDYRYVCGSCHLTGLNRNLEYSELGIGCEACHGAGKKHADKPEENHLRVPQGKDGCGCHLAKEKHKRKFRYSGTFHR